MSFHHVALNCQSIALTEAFYIRHFGFVRARTIALGDNKQIVFLRAGEFYLELFDAEGGPAYPTIQNDGPHDEGVRHIAFKVDNVDAKLAAMGDEARITLGPLDFDAFIPGWRTVWVADPDGTIVEISQGYHN